MAEIIELNIIESTVGGEAPVNNAFFGTKNKNTYNPAVSRGFDVKNIISPIRNNGTSSYFSVQQWKGMDIESRKDTQVTYFSSDSLSDISSLSTSLVLLTVLYRDEIRQVNMGSEQMVFDVKKILGVMKPRTSPLVGTVFYYIEEGDPNPVQYTVSETIAQIVAQNTGFVNKEVPAGTVDGVNADFTLANAAKPGTEYVFMNEGLLTNGVDYTMLGANITFTIPPVSSDIFYVTYEIA